MTMTEEKHIYNLLTGSTSMTYITFRQKYEIRTNEDVYALRICMTTHRVL